MPAESPAAVVYGGDRFLFVSQSPSDSRKGDGGVCAVEGTWEEALKRARGECWSAKAADLVLPAGDVLFVILDLPTTERAEIPAMVDLQAEEFTPFAMERTALGWEVVREGDGGFRVVMALAPLNTLQEARDRLAADGIRVKRVDVDVAGWWRRLQDRAPREGVALWLLLEESTSTWMVWEDGAPAGIQSLGGLSECDAEEVAEELDMAWMGVESDRGLERPESLTVWTAGEPPAWVDEHPGGFHVDTESLPDRAEAVAGLLERAGSGTGLDLAPPAWEEEHQAKRRRRAAARRLVWGLGLWILALGALVLWVRVRRGEIRALEERLEVKTPEVEAVRELGDQVRSLSKFTDRSSSMLEVMWMLARDVPGDGGLLIDDLRYRKDEGVVFSGSVEGAEPLFLNFVENLSGSELLRVVDYNLSRGRDGEQRFQVTTRWRWVVGDEEAGS